MFVEDFPIKFPIDHSQTLNEFTRGNFLYLNNTYIPYLHLDTNRHDLKIIHSDKLIGDFISNSINTLSGLNNLINMGVAFKPIINQHFNSNLTSVFSALINENNYNLNFKRDLKIIAYLYYFIGNKNLDSRYNLVELFGNVCPKINYPENSITCDIIFNRHIKDTLSNNENKTVLSNETTLSETSNITTNTSTNVTTNTTNLGEPLNLNVITLYPLFFNSRPIFSRGLNLTSYYRFENPYYNEIDLFNEYDSNGEILNSNKTQITKLQTYIDRINNFKFVVIKKVNIHYYNQILENFQDIMNNFQFYVLLSYLIICGIIVLISSFFIVKSTNLMIEKLKFLNNISKDVFMSPEYLHSLCSNTPKEEIDKVVLNALENKIYEKDKMKLFDENNFEKLYIVLIIELKKDLENFIDNIEDKGDVVQANSNFFKRKYRLCKLLTYI